MVSKKNCRVIRVNVLGQDWEIFLSIAIQRKQVVIERKNTALGNSIMISLNSLYLKNGLSTIEVNRCQCTLFNTDQLFLYLTKNVLST